MEMNGEKVNKIHVYVGFKRTVAPYETVDVSVSKSTDASDDFANLSKEVIEAAFEHEEAVLKKLQKTAFKQLAKLNELIAKETNLQRKQMLSSKKQKLIDKIIECGLDAKTYEELVKMI